MSKLRGQRGEGTCQNGTAERPKVHFSKVWVLPTTLEGVKEMGEARSETTGCSLPESQIPYTHSLPPAIPPVLKVHGGAPSMLPLPSLTPLHTPLLFPSSHSSPFPPPPPPPGSLCPSDSCLEPSVRWAAHQLLALLHSFIWVKSCSRNVEGNGGWGGRASWRAGIPCWAVHSSG